MRYIFSVIVFYSFVIDAAITKCGDPAKILVDGRCVPRCSEANEVFDGTQCVCSSGFERVGAVCELKCKPNHELVNGKCLRKCEPNQERDPAGNCQVLKHSKMELSEDSEWSTLTLWVASTTALSVTAGVFVIQYWINRHSRHEFSEVDDYFSALPDAAPTSVGLSEHRALSPGDIGRLFKDAAKKSGIAVLNNVNPDDPVALGKAFQRITDPQKISAFWGVFNSLVSGQQGSPKK